jgi:hypothetical protein
VPEFTDEYKTALNERTVHVKGFPPDTQLDDVMNFCKQFGTIENIEMRKYFKTKQFKVLFIIFAETRKNPLSLVKRFFMFF